MNLGEKMNLVAKGDASIARNVGVAEILGAVGIYQVECVRPQAQYVDEYLHHLRNADTMAKAGHFRQSEDLLARAWALPRDVVWQDTIHNTVATVGKNLALDTFLAGSSYTVVGPYLGLISSVSYSAIAAADTMASHSGWTEAGVTNAPTYTTPRKTAAWNAASAGSKALSAALSYAITGSGTVKGAFMVYGTGALTTIDNTAGTLLSAGLFTGGDKVVANTDTLNCSWSLAL